MMSSGTRVNWRKGFFRVWVLGAVLWMPLSALAVADDLARANRREAEAKFLADYAARPVPRDSNGVVTFDDIQMAPSEGASGSGMFDDLMPAAPGNTAPQEEIPGEWAAFPLASDVDAAAEAGAALDASDYSQVATVALIPPLVVLIAGFALGWVYRGFRAS